MRSELVSLALNGAEVATLARRFGVSRQCAHKWIRRAREEGPEGLLDQSRRPLASPGRSTAEIEAAVLAVRAEHPAWGGRKIRRRLQDLGNPAPSASTVTEILRRAGALETKREKRDWIRFERALPNELWQMDFKGHFATLEDRCHPFTLLDDHSRYMLSFTALPNEQTLGVKKALTQAFQTYGMPLTILSDNGSPFNSQLGRTALWAWLTRLDIELIHGRPWHPETQGKLERLHKTVLDETLARRSFANLAACQQRFDEWRQTYNLVRPHDSLKLDTPAKHFRPSPREFPAQLPPICYPEGDLVRKVYGEGRVNFKGKELRVSKALVGQPIALRQTTQDGLWEVRFCSKFVGLVDIKGKGKSVNYVPEQV